MLYSIKSKHLNLIIILFLFILFSFFYAKEYFLYHTGIAKTNSNFVDVKKSLSDFSFDKIREIDGLEIYNTPDKNLLKLLVEKIRNAKTRVYIEAYIFTEKDLRDALIKAKKSGIDVKVEMEKNVYMAGNLNKNTYNELIKNNIEVVWSDSSDYSLNHSKFFIIDDEVVLSTGNFSYSMFTKNRDFILFINDKIILKSLLENFLLDFKKERDFVYDDNLVLSPFFSREKIEFLLKNAKSDIKLYFPYFEDDVLLKILEDKLNSGTNIEIVTDKNNERVNELKNIGYKIKVLDKYTEHAKAILIDGTYLYLGSINFSTYSLDKNKETGIIIKDKNIVSKFLDIYKEDFKE
nr:phospholipase D-like domain-containing protein [Candidatus Gracilibacteria bacterium]